MTGIVKRLPRNTAGRDLFVGDIHGCFTRLAALLAEAGFDETKDRLISVGDLVDRGPESHLAPEWLAKPWFHAVMGNHEQMIVAYASDRSGTEDVLRNGGAWYAGMVASELLVYVDAVRDLPLAIEIEDEGDPVVVIHADVPNKSWPEARALLEARDRDSIERALWSRERIKANDDFQIEGAKFVVLGHTVMPMPTIVGNMLYLDTGACFGHALALFDPTHHTGPAIHAEADKEDPQ
ncbi:MAG: metallophosphoesterase [Burkholderiales bacterium]